METFQVLEAEEGIYRIIRLGLERLRPSKVRCSEDHPALLVISPGAAQRKLLLPQACRTVLLPGSEGRVLNNIRAASAVSYGESPRDSLTVSSREKERLWLSLQRELVTLEGRVVERQEIMVPKEPGVDTLSLLAAAGALLLLGVPPAALGRTLAP